MLAGKLPLGWIYFLLILFLANCNRIVIFTSSYNSYPGLYSLLSTYDFGIVGIRIEVYDIESTQEIDNILNDSYFYTIDYTDNVTLNGYLQQKARDNEKFNFVFGDSNQKHLSTHGFSFHGSLTNTQIIQMFWNIIVEGLDTSQLALLISIDAIKEILSGDYSGCAQEFRTTVFLSNNYENIRRQIGTELKSIGIRYAFILLTQDQEIDQYVINALEDKFMAGSGYAYVLVSETLHVLLNRANPVTNELLYNGLGFAIEEWVEYAQSVEEVQAMKIKKVIDMQKTDDNQFQVLSKDKLFECWYEQDHSIKGYMSWLNSQNGQIVQIGRFNDLEFIRLGEIVYPGGEIYFDINEKLRIEVTLYDGFEYINPEFGNSSLLALQEIEGQQFLPESLQLYAHQVSNAVQYGLPEEFLNQILQPADLKGQLICLIGIWSDEIIQQLYDYESENGGNYTIHSHPTSLTSRFHDPQTYPYFNLVAYPYEYTRYSYEFTYKFLNWSLLTAYYDKTNPTTVFAYSLLAANAPLSGIEIIGNPETNGFESYWSKDEFLDFMKPQLEEQIESRVRKVHFFSNTNIHSTNWVCEYLYQEGLRRGDIILIMPGFPSTQLQVSDLDSNEPLYQLIDYSLNIQTPLSDNQDQFTEFEQNYLESYGTQPSYFACSPYDAMYHLAHGLESTIAVGQDYEIPEILNLHLNRIIFTGCNGNIVFEQTSNIRKLIGFNILQFIYQDDLKDFIGIAAGQYNALASPVFSVPNAQWYEGEVPSDRRPLYKNCQFEKYQISTYEKGAWIMYTAGVVIFVYASIWTILFWFIYRNLKTIKITKNFYGMGDMIFRMLTIFEFVQLLSLSPGLIDDQQVKFLSIYPMIYLGVDDDIIQTQMYISYMIVSVMIISSVILVIKGPFEEIAFLLKFILTVAFGFLLYIPLISMLMDIFIWTEEAKDEPFFDIDCNTECWTQNHIVFLTLASLSLSIVIPAGVYLRIKFQEIITDLNILANPRFIALRWTMIVSMIVLSKLLQQHVYILTAFLSIVMLMQLGFYLLLMPINYARINLYKSALCLIYIVFIWFQLSPLSENFLILWIATLVSVIMITMLAVQHKFAFRFPKMLSFPKSHKIEGMIRFQFMWNDEKQVYRGRRKQSFLHHIKHRLSRVEIPSAEIIQTFHNESVGNIQTFQNEWFTTGEDKN